MTTSQNKSLLQSVQNGLLLLKVFSKDRPVWGITDISRELQLPKSTVSRLVGDLIKEGYLQKIGSKYRLGLSILCLAGVNMSNLEIHREAFEPLKSLVSKIDESAHISMLEGIQLIYLLKVECKQRVRLLSHVGQYRPPSCSSSGKLLLAYQPREIIDQVIKNGLPKRGPNSVTDPDQLLDELTTIKQNEYCVCIDEMHDDVVSIASPIKDYTGKVTASVSIAGPRQRIHEEFIPYFIDEIIKTGNEISYRLGYMESLFNK
ncbi:IclR family transcriptional regulator [Bacillus sp. V3B]|uniref:IclR family transcriptional regulator n=1 Tax=Bacillus sp. V3B TaxID=2804915 RepID=UPI00210C37C6|nr:IclR family transcriptional regulator [Bacillus sp. V3B]MCQ6274154.1 IclR family transcriptional regulator [Bacillus sp. V3B]